MIAKSIDDINIGLVLSGGGSKGAYEVEKRLENCDKNIKVAVMGCVVNGPGEAREADIGIAGGINEVLLFKKGNILRKIKQENVVEELKNEILLLINEKIS